MSATLVADQAASRDAGLGKARHEAAAFEFPGKEAKPVLGPAAAATGRRLNDHAVMSFCSFPTPEHVMSGIMSSRRLRVIALVGASLPLHCGLRKPVRALHVGPG